MLHFVYGILELAFRDLNAKGTAINQNLRMTDIRALSSFAQHFSETSKTRPWRYALYKLQVQAGAVPYLPRKHKTKALQQCTERGWRWSRGVIPVLVVCNVGVGCSDQLFLTNFDRVVRTVCGRAEITRPAEKERQNNQLGFGDSSYAKTVRQSRDEIRLFLQGFALWFSTVRYVLITPDEVDRRQSTRESWQPKEMLGPTRNTHSMYKLE